jgi:predicted transcriptional regulator
MAVAQEEKKFYREDELLGLVHRLMMDKDLLTYLKEHPWQHVDEIASNLEMPRRTVSHKLLELKFYGLLQSRYKEIIPPTEGKSGLAASFYALADDFKERTEQVMSEIRISRNKYSERHRHSKVNSSQ